MMNRNCYGDVEQHWVKSEKYDGIALDGATENQSGASSHVKPRIISLDPGVRTFMTGYSPYDGKMLEFGKQDVQRLCKLAHWIDKLSGKIAASKTCASRQRMKRARLKAFARIRNLVAEAHHQIANFLCQNFDIILLPAFDSKSMLKKQHKNGSWKRSISKKHTKQTPYIVVTLHIQTTLATQVATMGQIACYC